MERAKWIKNGMEKTEDQFLSLMSKEQVEKALHFHQSFPQYEKTPLVSLKNLAGMLGVKEIYVKDESFRFGLNAFKVLGGSYAMAKYIGKQTNKDVKDLPYHVLVSDELKKELGQAVFYTATDGNHGRGVAWAANKLNQKAVVFMPKGSTETRLQNILNENAEASILDVNYDECVRIAAAAALKTKNGVVIQDTAWDGYTEVPSWIMQGYGTLALEADRQLNEAGVKRPTHVFVQAGVGSLAGAVVGYFANRYPDNPPVMTVVEASAADCLYRSAEKQTGKLVNVTGDLETIMAGLACGEGNIISWDILKNHADLFVSAPDHMSAKGMRIYGMPLKGDRPVISGESGAVTMGVLEAAMRNGEYRELKEELGLDESSVVLLISTEGDTDPERYRQIVWSE